MSLLPIPQWAPDLSDFDGDTTQTILNVVPLAKGYGPFKAHNPLSGALLAACRGSFYARKNDGSILEFAGTSTELYTMNNTDLTWKPVSKVVALTSISNGSPAVFTLNSHGRSNGQTLVLSTTGTLPTGLTVGTVYYIINSATNTLNVSLTSGGSAVNTSGAGSGTHSMTNPYTALPASDQWQFVQFNNFVFATQGNTVLQRFDLTSSTAFSDAPGSPPQAKYIAVVGRFLMLTGLGSTTPYRAQWSGLNDTTNWTAGVGSSDFQDFPDGGIVRTVSGGQFGYVFQDGAIRRLTYNPGSVAVFQIDRIAQDRGIFAPLSDVNGGDRVFYIGSDGVNMILPGGVPQPIGVGRVDETFFADVDSSNLQLCIGASDPKARKAYWAYKSVSGASGAFDKIIGYDWAFDKFFVISFSGEYIFSLAQPGITLESLDSISSSIDALTGSLDDISTAAFPKIAAFDTSHKVGFFSGSNLEATMVTAKRSGNGRRMRIKGFTPITDAATVFGSVSRQDTEQQTATFSSEVAMNAKGIVPHNVSTRYARGKIRIPAGTTWTKTLGVEPKIGLEGEY